MGIRCRRLTFERVLRAAAEREPGVVLRIGHVDDVCTDRGRATGSASTAQRSTQTWCWPRPAGQAGSAGISARRHGAGTAVSPTSRGSTA